MMLAKYTSSAGDSQFPTVARLLLGCCPAAVAWFVVAVIVDAVESVPNSRALAHVGEECGEAIRSTPAITDANPAATVFEKFRVVRVKAPLLHTCPRLVCRGVPVSVGQMATLAEFCARHALSGSAACERGLKANACFPALTFT